MKGVRVVGAQGEVPSDAAADFGSGEIGGVGVDLKNNVVGNKPEAAARVCASIIEEAVTKVEGFSGRICLLRGNRVEGW